MKYYSVESVTLEKVLLVRLEEEGTEEDAVKIAVEKLNRERIMYGSQFRYSEENFSAHDIDKLFETRLDEHNGCITLC